MKYMLLVYGAEDAWTESEAAACMAESQEICLELAAEGKFIDASPLQPVATATCVQVRSGKKQFTDGPFAETTEQLGGFYVIDVPTQEEALAIASRIPPAKKGTIEVRPMVELADLPKLAAAAQA